jgi:hypothetical protein
MLTACAVAASPATPARPANTAHVKFFLFITTLLKLCTQGFAKSLNPLLLAEFTQARASILRPFAAQYYDNQGGNATKPNVNTGKF